LTRGEEGGPRSGKKTRGGTSKGGDTRKKRNQTKLLKQETVGAKPTEGGKA